MMTLKSTTNPLSVEADKISVALNTPDVSRTIALNILNVFDKIEHINGFLYKIKPYYVYGNIFFLIESIFRSRRL